MWCTVWTRMDLPVWRKDSFFFVLMTLELPAPTPSSITNETWWAYKNLPVVVLPPGFYGRSTHPLRHNWDFAGHRFFWRRGIHTPCVILDLNLSLFLKPGKSSPKRIRIPKWHFGIHQTINTINSNTWHLTLNRVCEMYTVLLCTSMRRVLAF